MNNSLYNSNTYNSSMLKIYNSSPACPEPRRGAGRASRGTRRRLYLTVSLCIYIYIYTYTYTHIL